ncbi:hypothetical protein TYRP_005801 [Tyrophagus putrescentiae]|nr:hypothetical protein TYRP_005801 [Tyrophagus putrescentiae]
MPRQSVSRLGDTEQSRRVCCLLLLCSVSHSRVWHPGLLQDQLYGDGWHPSPHYQPSPRSSSSSSPLSPETPSATSSSSDKSLSLWCTLCPVLIITAIDFAIAINNNIIIISGGRLEALSEDDCLLVAKNFDGLRRGWPCGWTTASKSRMAPPPNHHHHHHHYQQSLAILAKDFQMCKEERAVETLQALAAHHFWLVFPTIFSSTTASVDCLFGKETVLLPASSPPSSSVFSLQSSVFVIVHPGRPDRLHRRS